MKDGSPSRTAYEVALARAAHQTLDAPRVLDDPVAGSIVGAQGLAEIGRGGRRFDSVFARALRAFVVARSRCAEDELAVAVARGVRQYVVLGAGLATFACRNPFAAGGLKVFEVDHPATQAWKRQRLASAGIAEPPSLVFTPTDFDTQSVFTQLAAVGFDARQPAFFSWLGVTMYLPQTPVLRTLQSIAKLPHGSGIVFDYLAPPPKHALVRRIGLGLLKARLASLGEPFRSDFEPGRMAAELGAAGFAQVRQLGAQDINASYFRARTDGLQARGSGHIAIASN